MKTIREINFETVDTVLKSVASSYALVAHEMLMTEGAVRKWVRENRIPARGKKLLSFVYGIDLKELDKF